jgi:hypothetical protein
MVDFSGLKDKLMNKDVQDAQVEEAPDLNNLEDLLGQLASVNPELAKNIREIEVNTLQIMVERNKKQGYGESYAIMGIQGAAFQVIHKAARLLNTIYDTEEQGFKMTGKEMVASSIDEQGNWKQNSVFDHLLDLLNYSRLTMNLFIRARNQGALPSGEKTDKSG